MTQRNFTELHAVMKNRLEADFQSAQLQKRNEFDYSYLSLNSLYKNQNSSEPNRLDFSVVAKGESQLSTIGVSINPSQIVQIRISPINLGRKFEADDDTVSELQLGKLFVSIPQFISQAFSSHDGFKYHFGFNIQENPNDLTQLVATPVNEFYNFSNPVRFDGNISFDFYTNRKYEFEKDTYECYADYGPVFLTLYRVDGQPHNLSNLDIVFIENFEVPGIVQKSDPFTATHKSKQYRVSVVDAQNFTIQVQLPNQIKTSINRPADQFLGVYKPPIQVTILSGNPTVISSPIPHGLQSGNSARISQISRNDAGFLLGSWNVTVISANQFSIPVDSSAVVGQISGEIAEFPISQSRVNSLYVKIVTKKADFSLTLKSISDTAKNGLQNLAQ